MRKVRIEVYEDGAPAVTISVPAWVVTSAARLLPKVAGRPLGERVELGQVAEMLKNPQASGTLIEIEDHHAGDRVIVSIVGNET